MLLEERDARLQPAHVVPQAAVLEHDLQQALREPRGHGGASAWPWRVLVHDSLVYKFFHIVLCGLYRCIRGIYARQRPRPPCLDTICHCELTLV